jgi:nucleotide-binding universal stress UspA family protein
MHRFLVPIDGSECAGRALDHALKLAKQIDGVELVLLHVQPEPTVYGEIQVYVPAERMQELQAKHSKNILNQAVEKTEPAGVAHACKTRTGDFATEIVPGRGSGQMR